MQLSQQQFMEEILYRHELFRLDRFPAHVPVGPMAHAEVMRVIELLRTEVAPAVRREVGGVGPGRLTLPHLAPDRFTRPATPQPRSGGGHALRWEWRH